MPVIENTEIKIVKKMIIKRSKIFSEKKNKTNRDLTAGGIGVLGGITVGIGGSELSNIGSEKLDKYLNKTYPDRIVKLNKEYDNKIKKIQEKNRKKIVDKFGSFDEFKKKLNNPNSANDSDFIKFIKEELSDNDIKKLRDKQWKKSKRIAKITEKLPGVVRKVGKVGSIVLAPVAAYGTYKLAGRKLNKKTD